ncbi:tripartite tricarboxylate transporter TctB family protein [Pelagibacterium lacus]|uniref:DUF1468 domain-containing protein n=1 Tax=Pelagibacterium lacus TaxID=2282655 RepID=A0A369W2C5_9HYPH|nr:tripartite tricarboxylate transporter TctB family protein [Pelagibacterium lacus]RDE08698.1 hypothetical protein DVH29_10415 [Pelagibacterium lacus]
MLPHRARRKMDIVVSFAMICFGIVVLIAASQMPWAPRSASGAVQWYLSPGLYPATLGFFLVVFSSFVLWNAVREVGIGDIGTMFRGWMRNLPTNHPVHRVVIAMLLVGLYIFVGIGLAEFWIVSAVFLFVFIALFWFPEPGMKLAHRVPISLAISVLIPLAVAFVFETYFYVPMP